MYLSKLCVDLVTTVREHSAHASSVVRAKCALEDCHDAINDAALLAARVRRFNCCPCWTVSTVRWGDAKETAVCDLES